MNNHNMVQDNQNVNNLAKELQMAREMAILGQYEESMSSFKQIVTKIQFQIKKNLNDQFLYDKWEQLNNQVQDEVDCVQNMIKIQRQLESKEAADSSAGLDFQEFDSRPVGASNNMGANDFDDRNMRNDQYVQKSQNNPNYGNYNKRQN